MGLFVMHMGGNNEDIETFCDSEAIMICGDEFMSDVKLNRSPSITSHT